MRLQAVRDEQLTFEMKDGTSVAGALYEVDANLNATLRGATQTLRNGTQRRYESAYVNGSGVLYVLFPARCDPVRSLDRTSTRRSASRGRRRARSARRRRRARCAEGHPPSRPRRPASATWPTGRGSVGRLVRVCFPENRSIFARIFLRLLTQAASSGLVPPVFMFWSRLSSLARSALDLDACLST